MSEMEIYENIRKAAGVSIPADSKEGIIMMYNLGKLLGGRAEIARIVLTHGYSNKSSEPYQEMIKEYNKMIKQLLAIP